MVRTALFGALDPADPRLHATMALLERELGAGDLLFRYAPEEENDVPAPGAEGAFTACGFWLANVQGLAGQTRRAQERFEALLARANDVGLFAEETDPATGEMLGNFPQGFSHMSVVIGAAHLGESLERFGVR